MAIRAGHATLAEFMALPDDGNRYELVRGEVRVMPPPGSTHGLVEAAIVEAIGRYLYDRANALGWEPRHGIGARNHLVGFVAGGEFGMQFALPDDQEQVRGADCVYVPPDQLADVAWDRNGYFPAVPRLTIEIISPSEKASDVAEKVHDYLAGGAWRVWCVYPERQAVYIYAADAPMRVVRAGGSLTDVLLPRFSLPINLIFS